MVALYVTWTWVQGIGHEYGSKYPTCRNYNFRTGALFKIWTQIWGLIFLYVEVELATSN